MMELENKTTLPDNYLLGLIKDLWPNEDCKFGDDMLKERCGLRYSATIDSNINKVIEVCVERIGRRSLFKTTLDAIRLTMGGYQSMVLNQGKYDGLVNMKERCACRNVFDKYDRCLCNDFDVYDCEFAVKRADGTFAEYKDDEIGYEPKEW
jgi:hypothetical protein